MERTVVSSSVSEEVIEDLYLKIQEEKVAEEIIETRSKEAVSWIMRRDDNKRWGSSPRKN